MKKTRQNPTEISPERANLNTASALDTIERRYSELFNSLS
jgi:hypothetical protein